MHQALGENKEVTRHERLEEQLLGGVDEADDQSPILNPKRFTGSRVGVGGVDALG